MSDDRREVPETPAEKPAGDRHRAEIERLERAIADERQYSADLRKAVDELQFKMGILEQSYAKQLEDERLRSEKAEEKIAEQGVRIVELDQAREDAIELLSETKTELDRLTEERDQLRRQLASRDGWQVEQPDDDFTADGGTINALMNDAKWIRKGDPENDDRGAAKSGDVPDDESPSEEMIAPDLVFVARKSDD